MARDPRETVRAPRTLEDFAASLRVGLPRRLREIRALGRQTRALGIGRRKGRRA